MIKEKSPKLWGLLGRLFDETDLQLFESAFEISARCGGLAEIDFERDPDTSYNPRPARVAQIVIEQGGCRASQTVAAAILACGDPQALALLADEPPLKAALQLARAAAESAQCAAPDVSPRLSPPAEVVFCALWLDRARHFHLVDPDAARSLEPAFIAKTEAATAAARRSAPRIAELLEAWLSRRLRAQQ